MPQMTRLRATALALSKCLRSVQISINESGVRMSFCSSLRNDGTVAMATRVLERDMSKGRLKKKKTICGLNKNVTV